MIISHGHRRLSRTFKKLALILLLGVGGDDARMALAGAQGQSPKNPIGYKPSVIMRQVQGTRTDQSRYLYDPGRRRDPFIPLLSPRGSHDRKNDSPSTQQTAETDVTVLGIMSGRFGCHAVIQTVGGKGHIVEPGSVLGLGKWMVKEITDTAVILQERGVDRNGKRRIGEKVIHLSSSQ